MYLDQDISQETRLPYDILLDKAKANNFRVGISHLTEDGKISLTVRSKHIEFNKAERDPPRGPHHYRHIRGAGNMEVTPNRDHRMPQHIDVWDHIQECARKNLCCVWGCGKAADINDNKLAPGINTDFAVPFCKEHRSGYLATNEAIREGYDADGDR